ncbi:hypothetical protein ARMSODRAFT_967482 [Armillaria solidipes]|uniref:Uncharacterized protein n=1 Tax=Armillaria solidipes TaxID=1076256 RepID=A0A2H3ALW1_9AGAR|nr:hypothetical protein ARMSODRAFT_967482 [Armillaria solidipes]
MLVRGYLECFVTAVLCSLVLPVTAAISLGFGSKMNVNLHALLQSLIAIPTTACRNFLTTPGSILTPPAGLSCKASSDSECIF